MELKEVVSISGMPGLYKIVGHRVNGLIVESIDSQKKRFPTSFNQKVSILEDIAMFTLDGDVRLSEVLQKTHSVVEAGESIPDKKAKDEEIRSFFEKILPNFDKERVYTTDIRKLFTWYGILKTELDFNNLGKEAGSEEEANTEEEKGEKAKKKVSAKKTENKTIAKSDTKAKSVKTAAPKVKTNTPRKTGGGA